jgi:hypothetical protein
MNGQWSARSREAERLAGQAWDEMVAALESGGEAARSIARRTADLTSELADEAGDRVRPALRESRRRAGAALEALAGRRPPVQWEWILAAAIGGVAVGWLAATVTRKAAQERLILDEAAVQADETAAPLARPASLP